MPPHLLRLVACSSESGVYERLTERLSNGHPFEDLLAPGTMRGLELRARAPDELAQMLLDSPSIIDVSYGAKSLVQNLFVPPDCIVNIGFPILGAHPALEALHLVDRYIGPHTVDVFGITPTVKLSRAEAAALRLMSDDEAFSIVGERLPGKEGWTDWLLLLVGVGLLIEGHFHPEEKKAAEADLQVPGAGGDPNQQDDGDADHEGGPPNLDAGFALAQEGIVHGNLRPSVRELMMLRRAALAKRSRR